MNLRPFALFVLSAASVARVLAADEPAPPKSHMKEILKARTAEEAKKKQPDPILKPEPKEDLPAPLAAGPLPTPVSVSPAAAPAPAAGPVTKDAAKTTPPAKPAAAEPPPTVLPKVEVKKDRITVLDHNLAMQEKEIEREKKNTTPTELDKALNDSKVSKALSIFGGQSGDYRANISKERVQMMQEEKEVIEAIAHAKTKEEKAELQKQLDELRALRRDLEKSLR